MCLTHKHPHCGFILPSPSGSMQQQLDTLAAAAARSSSPATGAGGVQPPTALLLAPSLHQLRPRHPHRMAEGAGARLLPSSTGCGRSASSRSPIQYSSHLVLRYLPAAPAGPSASSALPGPPQCGRHATSVIQHPSHSHRPLRPSGHQLTSLGHICALPAVLSALLFPHSPLAAPHISTAAPHTTSLPHHSIVLRSPSSQVVRSCQPSSASLLLPM
jgi:hypothetical protein